MLKKKRFPKQRNVPGGVTARLKVHPQYLIKENLSVNYSYFVIIKKSKMYVFVEGLAQK